MVDPGGRATLPFCIVPIWKVEKKTGAGNAKLSDLRTFVLSLIGDEKQMDYDAVLPIAWMKQ